MKRKLGKVITCLFKCDNEYCVVYVHPCVTTDMDKARIFSAQELYNTDDFREWVYVKQWEEYINID